MAIASGSDWTCGTRGATSTRREKPIVFSARAAAPTLPGWLGSTSTKRVDVKPPRTGAALSGPQVSDDGEEDEDGVWGVWVVATMKWGS
jgi:hypothetical protein